MRSAVLVPVCYYQKLGMQSHRRSKYCVVNEKSISLTGSHNRRSSMFEKFLIKGSRLLVVATLASACGDHVKSQKSHTDAKSAAVPTSPTDTYLVTQFGATTVSQNNRSAFQAAFDEAAIRPGGIVYVPPGTWKIAGHLQLPAITLEGAGKLKSAIVETVPAADLLSTSKNGTVVEDLTLNTQTYDGGHAFGTIASYTKLQQVDVLRGNQPGHCAFYYAGPSGASRTNLIYSQGNVVNDVYINDQICDDGFSWSFKKNGTISNATQVGSRLALYLDNTDTVTNYYYTPGSQKCDAHQGFGITPPSENISITNFQTDGNGGKISSDSIAYSSNIHITGLRFLSTSGFNMQVGGVRGLTITDSNYGSGNSLVFDASVRADPVILSNTTLSRITYASKPGADIRVTCSGVAPVRC